MNFLLHQYVTDGASVLDTAHFKHCYIYEGEHCSCGGDYQGSQPGPDVRQFLQKAERAQAQDTYNFNTGDLGGSAF